MGVDRLLTNLDGRTMPANTQNLQEYSVQVRLAKALIEAIGIYKAKHPDVTDAIAAGAVKMVAKCIDENDGKID
jgi:uncharacterized metal-binding protein